MARKQVRVVIRYHIFGNDGREWTAGPFGTEDAAQAEAERLTTLRAANGLDGCRFQVVGVEGEQRA